MPEIRFRFPWLPAAMGLWCWSCQAPAPQNTSTADDTPPPADSSDLGIKKSFGMYQWDKDASYGDGLTREIMALGTPPSYALYFVDLQRGFPGDVVRFNAERNIQSIVTQELCAYGQDWDPRILSEILQGHWDGYFRNFARAAKNFHGIVYYRFGYEMNGDWTAWGEQPELFRRAWRHVHAIFQRAGARNVRWVFSANVLWGDRTFAHDILPYYPGDRYVDVVGLDGYNFGARHPHVWQSFSQVFSASIAGMKKHFARKPLWITEVGCADGPQKAAWILDFLQHFNADPDLRSFVWFNEDKRYAGEPNWRLDSDGDSMQRFRSWAIFNNSITLFSLPDDPDPAPPLSYASGLRSRSLL